MTGRVCGASLVLVVDTVSLTRHVAPLSKLIPFVDIAYDVSEHLGYNIVSTCLARTSRVNHVCTSLSYGKKSFTLLQLPHSLPERSSHLSARARGQ